MLLTRLQKPGADPDRVAVRPQGGHRPDLRLQAAGVLPRDVSVSSRCRPQQSEVRAIFAPLARIQRDSASPAT